MDFLRPSAGRVDPTSPKVAQQPQKASSHRLGQASSSSVVPRPSPNCSASFNAALRTQHASKLNAVPSPQGNNSGVATNKASAAAAAPQAMPLPAFLGRKPAVVVASQQTTTATPTSSLPVEEIEPPRMGSSRGRDSSDTDLHGDVGSEHGGEEAMDEALFAQLIDDDEEPATDAELRTMAEDLSVSTGMPMTEVMDLLMEHRAQKTQRKGSREKRGMEVAPPPPPPPLQRRASSSAREPQRSEEEAFLTATPDLIVVTHVAGSSAAAVVPLPPLPQHDAHHHHQASSSSRRNILAVGPPPAPERKTSAASNVHEAMVEEEEHPADRMRRMLNELFPQPLQQGSTPRGGRSDQSSSVGRGARSGDDDFVDLKTFRAQRQAQLHSKVVQHLSQQRGEVELPRSLQVNDAFVKAYQLEHMKRTALKELKEAMQKRVMEEEEKQRVMKGIFSNLAIKTQIAEREKKQQAAAASSASTSKVVGVLGGGGTRNEAAGPDHASVIGNSPSRPKRDTTTATAMLSDVLLSSKPQEYCVIGPGFVHSASCE